MFDEDLLELKELKESLFEKKNIEFTILNSKNEPVVINCHTCGNDMILYRGGLAIKCNCTPEPGKLNCLIYNEGRVYCPNCGREAISVKSHDSLHLIPVGLDQNTMQELYRLSDKIDYSIWLKVADYFIKLKPDDVDLPYSPSYIGWVTPNPRVVESTLGIREDLRISNRDITSELEAIMDECKLEDNSERTIYNLDIVDRLHEVFSIVETPYGKFQLWDGSPDGSYVVNNPLFPPNPSIGNGEFWYVKRSSNEIWYIRCNYNDGADRRMNNVFIDLELKAIGKRIPYDEDVEQLLQELKNNNE